MFSQFKKGFQERFNARAADFCGEVKFYTILWSSQYAFWGTPAWALDAYTAYDPGRVSLTDALVRYTPEYVAGGIKFTAIFTVASLSVYSTYAIGDCFYQGTKQALSYLFAAKESPDKEIKIEIIVDPMVENFLTNDKSVPLLAAVHLVESEQPEKKSAAPLKFFPKENTVKDQSIQIQKNSEIILSLS